MNPEEDVTDVDAERRSREAESSGRPIEAAFWAARAAEEHARRGGFLEALTWCKTAVRLDASWTDMFRALDAVARGDRSAEGMLEVAAAALEKTGRADFAAALRRRARATAAR
ncbi:MAG: hypothetical protein QM817_38310 [Archangium sp.]